jgi:hypothetical protein
VPRRLPRRRLHRSPVVQAPDIHPARPFLHCSDHLKPDQPSQTQSVTPPCRSSHSWTHPPRTLDRRVNGLNWTARLASAEPGARAGANAYGRRHRRGLSACGYGTNIEFQPDIGDVVQVVQQSWYAQLNYVGIQGLVGSMRRSGRGDTRRAGSSRSVRTTHILHRVSF